MFTLSFSKCCQTFLSRCTHQSSEQLSSRTPQQSFCKEIIVHHSLLGDES